MTGSDPSGTVTRPKSNGGPGRDDRHARAFVNDGRCDRALRAHVDALSAIPRALVVRDGGDEVLIVGTPTVTGRLNDQLDAFRQAWPDWARAKAAVLPGDVVPRILTVEGPAATLSRLRNELGSKMGPFKAQVRNPGLMGAIARLCPERAFAIEYEEEST